MGSARLVLVLLGLGQVDSLGLLARRVAQRYFLDARCVGVITDGAAAAADDDLAQHLSDVLPALRIRLDGPVHTADALMRDALDARCLAFVVRVADAQMALRRLAEETKSVLHMREMNYMPDLVEATLLDEGAAIELATHRFVGQESAQDRVLLDVWLGDGFRDDADLYPYKLGDMQGRRVVFASFNYPPYVVVNQEVRPPLFDGMELQISMQFAIKHNISWSVSVDPVNEWGEVYDNFTGNGILGNVVQDKAELGMGALYLWYHEYQLLDFSYPYIRTGITCLAPQPRLLPGWMAPVLPFSTAMWTAVGASLVVSTFALYLVARASRELLGDGNQGSHGHYTTLGDCAFRTLGLLVLQTPDNERRETREVGPTRHVLTSLLVVFLLVTSIYSGGLASVLAVPRREPPIDTVADLAKSDIRWAATHEAWVFSLREATDTTNRRVYQKFMVLKEETLRQRSMTGDMAFSIERLPGGHFAVGDYIGEEAVPLLRLMSQDLYWERSTTVARKGSPLVAPLNDVIHRLLDAGLMQAWENQVARRYLSYRVQVGMLLSGAADTSHEPAKLTVSHVQGGFILLLLGIGGSSLVFLGELLSVKRKILSPSWTGRKVCCSSS